MSDKSKLEDIKVPSYNPFTPPFRYYRDTGRIVDSEGSTVMAVRCRPHHSHKQWSKEKTIEVEDRFGLWVEELMNVSAGVCPGSEDPEGVTMYAAYWQKGMSVGVGATMELAVNDYLLNHAERHLEAHPQGTMLIRVSEAIYDPEPKQEEDDWTEPGEDYVLGPEVGYVRYRSFRLAPASYKFELLAYSRNMDNEQIINHASQLRKP